MPSDTITSGPQSSPHPPDWLRTYKIMGGSELKAHGFSPRDLRPGDRRVAVVFFHPGGWSKGEPAWGYDLCHHCAGLGMVAISFQYRLSSIGGHTPVEAVSDARSAIRWTRQQAGILGADPTKIVAMAVSAGAHLALCAAMLTGPNDPGDDPALDPVPDALVLQSAPVNSASDQQFVELLQGRYKPEDYSPAGHIRSGLPAMSFIHGTADEIVPYESVREFVSAMKRAGNACELHSFGGTDHFFRKESDRIEAQRTIDAFLLDLP